MNHSSPSAPRLLALHEPSMFSPQIQGYHRLAGNQICGSSESAGKTLGDFSELHAQSSSASYQLPVTSDTSDSASKFMVGAFCQSLPSLPGHPSANVGF